MKTNSMVSVIITTKNEEKNIEACLKSIKKQTFPNTEILVIDNNSSDRTKEIARKYTTQVFNNGPERSSQRNFGAENATGEYVLFLDADMTLEPSVIKDCVELIESNKSIGGVIIPEKSFGVGFWAQCKGLERSFYIGNDFIEGARFFIKKIFEKVGGFDTTITGPEDWDLSQRVRQKYKIGRISSYILHNEGKLSLSKTMQKKYYYSKKFAVYMSKGENKKYIDKQFSVYHRYKLFFSDPAKLFGNPILGGGMLFMKSAEFFAGLLGYIGTMGERR